MNEIQPDELMPDEMITIALTRSQLTAVYVALSQEIAHLTDERDNTDDGSHAVYWQTHIDRHQAAHDTIDTALYGS